MRTKRDDQRFDPARQMAQPANDEFMECSTLTEPSRHVPRVVVYSSDEAVPSQRFVAYVTIPTQAPKTGVMSERRLGISFPAADGDTARAAASAWWQGELDRERARLEAAIERGKKLAASREAKASPLPPMGTESGA